MTEDQGDQAKLNADPSLLDLGIKQRLAVLASLGILDAPLERNFQVLVDAARELIAIPGAIIYLVTEEHQCFVSFSGIPDSIASKRKIPFAHSLCKHVVSQKAPLVVADASNALLLRDNPAIKEQGVGAYLGVPLEHNGIAVGAFCVIDSQVREWTDTEFTILEKLAGLTARELTIRDEFRRQKSHLESRLQHAQKMESIGQFTSGVVHDFNNVLATIQIYAELLESRLANQPDDVALVKNIDEALNSAKETVQQLLDWSRPDHGNKSNVKLSKIVEDMLPLLCVALSKRIEVSFESRTDNGLIFGNVNSLRQVLLNLCLNAEHAMVKRGGEVAISLHDYSVEEGAQQPGDLPPGAYVNLRVADNGHGIPADLLDRLYEPYFTTKPVEEGTGLGLWTVAGIVEGHGATIQVESELDVGTTFNIYFPRVKIDSAAAASKRILVVDDDPVVANSIGSLLEAGGYKTDVFTDSTEALDALCNNPDSYRLVIADYGMPGLNGAQLLDECRRIAPLKPFVLCSGQLSHESMAAAKADACCAKPFDLKTLTETIESLLHV